MQQPFSWSSNPTGYTLPDYQDWSVRLEQAEAQIKAMSEQFNELQNQLQEMKGKPPVHIEYHFDQLKVNRLEGTLNVGLTPQSIQELEDLDIKSMSNIKPACSSPTADEPPIPSLLEDIDEYMDTQAGISLNSLESQYGVILDSLERSKVIEDVKKQLNERVHYYARMSDYPAKGTEAEQQTWIAAIKNKTIRDVQTAFSSYLQKRLEQSNSC